MATVLVVEDAPSQLELINSFLRDSGHTVIKAYNAKDGMSNDRQVALLGAVRQKILSGIRDANQYNRLKNYLHAFPNLELNMEDYKRWF
ncbi:MAG: hypothetical protein V7K48_30830 [Nostoc sp.]|uniref:hypothetical protein n=1 Tax=Nostoc sp. TaxID=1180 RepID=UPI002FF9FA85